MFTAETTRFLSDLAANNTREWFTTNRARYETCVAAPTKAFVTVFAAEIERASATPIDSRVFRIHRDLRFAKDKTPYNAHIHLSWRSATAPLSWMVGLEPDRLVLGYGCFGFGPAGLDRWRQAVDGPAGLRLRGFLDGLIASGMHLSDPELKRVPTPFAAEHPRGDLLRNKSLAVWAPALPPDRAYGPEAPVLLAREMAVFAPLHDWVCATL
jgi:uncharacterized protein (TIGR02453 family)